MRMENNNNNNSNIPNGRELAERYGYPVMDPDKVRAVGYGEDTISGFYNPPMVDPFSASKRSKSQIPMLSERIRNTIKMSYYDDVANASPLTYMAADQSYKGRFNTTGPEVSLEDSRYRLSDGTWIPKYENYVPGVDNDTRLSKTQSRGEKWSRGLRKFVGKSLLYGLGGIVQPFNMIYQGVSRGKWEATYNNDFSRWLDDQDKKMDYGLAHYYNREERDMGFLKSMTTANFWSNDFLSGLAFTAGAMISSYAFAGAGLMNFARLGAKAGAVLGGLGKAASVTKSGFNAMLRGARIGRGIGKGLDVMTFLGTSTSWEASVEAKSMLMEAEENYRRSYRQAYGKDPSYEELMRFRADNVDAANSVFAANIAILSLSNIAMFGDMFNISTGADKFIKRNILGLGAERTKDGTMRAITAGRWQKLAGNAFNIVKRPVSEGLFEEGLQGVSSRAAEEWISSRYDPMAIRQNIDYMTAIKNGFRETYGTKEGWKEIGIGMIIGAGMSPRNIFGIRERAMDKAALDKNIENYNANNKKLTEASINAIRGSMAVNGQIAGSDKLVTGKDFGDAVYSRLRYESEMGMLDDTKENFKATIESIPNEDIAKDMNMTVEEVDNYKSQLIDRFNEKVDNFNRADRFAKLMTEGMSNRVFENYISEMAYNGLGARAEMRELGGILDKYTNGELGKALDVYSHVSPDANKAREQVQELIDAATRIERLILEFQKTSMTEEDRASKAEELRKLAEDLESINNRRVELERRLAYMVNGAADASVLENLGYELGVEDRRGESIVTSGDVIAAYNTIREFEDVVASRGVENYREVMSLLDEYRNSLTSYRNMSESLGRMRDRRFLTQEERGFARILASRWKEVSEEDDKTLEYRDTSARPDASYDDTRRELYANDQAIDEAVREGKLDENEGYLFKTYNHMVARAMSGESTPNNEIVEKVPDGEVTGTLTEDRAEDIAIKIWNGNEDVLSPNERAIYDNNKDYIDSKIADLGDNVSSRLSSIRGMLANMMNGSDQYAKIKGLVNNIVDANMDGRDKDQVKEAIRTYTDLMNDSDNGKDVDRDKLGEAITIIGNYSSDPLLDYIEWMRIYERPEIRSSQKDITVPMDDLLTDTEVGVGSVASSPNIAQNPEILMAHIVEINSVFYHEVGGIRLDRFIDTHLSGYERVDSETSGGYKAVELRNPDTGDTIHIVESGEGRWMIVDDRGELDRFENATGIILGRQTALSTSNWYVVYRKGEDGSIAPYRPNDTFGPRGNKESINQHALSVLKGGKGSKKGGDKVYGSPLTVVVEMEDEYTDRLYDEYVKVLDDPSSTDEDLANAKANLANNMVIKLRDKDGNLVSVMSALRDDSRSGAVKNLRLSLANEYIARKRGDNMSDIELDDKVSVSTMMYGRPNLNVTDENGELQVREIDVTPEAARRIESVGYIENGQVTLRDEDVRDQARTYPYCTAIVRKAKSDYKDTRVPVVAIRMDNGDICLYPVSLKGSDTSSADDASLIRMYANDARNVSISTDMIREVNNLISKYGIGMRDHIIPMIGTVGEIADAMNKAADAIEGMVPSVDMTEWISGDRSKDDILMGDVRINIDLNNDPFIAPKIRLEVARGKVGPSGGTAAEARESASMETTASPSLAPGTQLEISFGEDLDLPFDKGKDRDLIDKGKVDSGKKEVDTPC